MDRDREFELLDKIRRLEAELEVKDIIAQDLIKSKENFRQLTETIDQVFWLTDWKTKELIYVSPAFEDIFEITREDAYQDKMNWLSVIHKEDRARVGKIFAESAEKGIYAEAEYRIITESGKEKWIYDRSYPIHDKTGELIKFVSIAEEITAKKQIELALKESEENSRKLAENTSDVIFVIKDMKCLYANPAVEKILGYKLTELDNYTIIDMIYEEDRDLIKENYFKRLSGEEIESYDVRIRRKDGSLFWGGVNASIINWKNNKALIYFIRDNTKRIEVEKKLEKNLEEKNELLRELFHRTKNNMQVIISMMSIKSRHIKDDRLQQIFREISGKIRVMSLAQQKLYLSQNLSSIKLNDYINEIITMMKLTYFADNDQLEINEEYEETTISIGKALPVGMVINELMSNAMTHGFPNGESGRVDIKLYQDEKGLTNIKFSDNGVGLKDETNLREVNTLGLQNVFSMILHQLKGEVDYISDGGLSWHIRFKDNP